MKSIIPNKWDVPQEIIRLLGKSLKKQRLINFEDNLILILHHCPEHGNYDREAAIFWRNPKGE
ncbi:MAG: hypothetical protein HRT89_13195 [Lentisphaeria bacterium]|nr:hypothetical protein [Lentisphaeria bacterium]NQZ69013.1 hypothetical protein [Lentisphaeria bacterium]